MPELPEVEIAARNLREWAIGRRIERVEAEPAARYVFRPATPRRFAAEVAGRRFESVARRGKQLLIALGGDGGPLGLLAHLGMTGKWLRRREGERVPEYVKARFHLDDGHVLHFRDPRLFGRLRVVPGARFAEVPEVAELGPDPLEEGIDPARLGAAFARIRRPVKVALMDQALLPGVGNILASEACFRAGVDPRRPANGLARAQVEHLAAAVLEAVRETIAREQGPEIAYVEEGGAENPFLVYAREGERCPRCRRAEIRRFVQAQRSTFWCPRCQK
jgi:formamidopyrimidine-DNA glycosylase